MRAHRHRTAAVLGAACLCVLLAACGPTAKTAARPAAPGYQAGAGSESVDLIDLAAPGLGLIGLGTGAQGTGFARLVVSLDSGRSFTAIGPATAAGTATDDVFFRNRQDGWFIAYNIATTSDALYRTTDGGRSWQPSSVAGHAQAAGSQDTVQFVSATHGWLLSLQPTGPLESLAVTTNGGATWRVVASLHPSAGEGLLPEFGLVQFTAAGTGWLGSGQYSQALYRTADGGRSWQHVSISAPSGSLFGLPTAFGTRLIEPVTIGTSLALYRSIDGGTHWSRISALPDVNAGCGIGQVSVSLPTPTAGWIATVQGKRTVVYRSIDGGLQWTRLATSWPVPPDSCEAPVIQATDALHAWVFTTGSARIYATSSGGATWSRIDLTAVAAARG
ncbi:MAG TPA: YCF48-related protein [Streptosporangiaceae bacterium]|nr:YCF48-related protein [Streptosporangiaceae bacterium]